MKKWTLASALGCILPLNSIIGFAQELGPPPMADSNDLGSVTGPAAELVAVNLNDRTAVVQLYQATYLASQGVASGWNGNRGTCTAGSTSQAYADATILRVNYYRAMAGLPGDVVLSNAWNAKAQQAALMMSAQGSLSHSPDTNWSCYTAGGAEAAGKSNLALGADAAAAIDLYMDDPGSGGNAAAGHRRWILYPPTKLWAPAVYRRAEAGPPTTCGLLEAVALDRANPHGLPGRHRHSCPGKSCPARPAGGLFLIPGRALPGQRCSCDKTEPTSR